MKPHEGLRRRSLVALSFVLVGAVLLTQLPVHWHDIGRRIDWGTVPEWVMAFALVGIAVVAWRFARRHAAASAGEGNDAFHPLGR